MRLALLGTALTVPVSTLTATVPSAMVVARGKLAIDGLPARRRLSCARVRALMVGGTVVHVPRVHVGVQHAISAPQVQDQYVPSYLVPGTALVKLQCIIEFTL